ncbi:hypothetical protein EYF80_040952 [Liparis tanakae]|uniref:Uncharacterized protein n=1 Tax=Liparis tanakae TaxID=230148 RepID=A0A4Z2G5I9_9TELE|nr:hypothetical protein EYF80_040952 [Liparis tanakae]
MCVCIENISSEYSSLCSVLQVKRPPVTGPSAPSALIRSRVRSVALTPRCPPTKPRAGNKIDDTATGTTESMRGIASTRRRFYCSRTVTTDVELVTTG